MLANLPPVTRALLLTNVGIFLLQQLAGQRLLEWFALWPPGTLFQPWQVVTYAFLHNDILHIFFNMFALFMFGTPLERHWGGRRYTVFYFVCIVAAALTQLTVSVFQHSDACCFSRPSPFPPGHSLHYMRCLRCSSGSPEIRRALRTSRTWVACWVPL
jgi:membrane associated rhomboid family serine protease